MKTRFDIAISYASEDLAVSDAVADRLRQDGYSVFYAPNERHRFFGRALNVSFEMIFGDLAEVVVAVFSENYVHKAYPIAEFEAAIAREARTGRQHLVVLRLDDSPLPTTAAHLTEFDARTLSPEIVARRISAFVTAQKGVIAHSVRISDTAAARLVHSVVALDHPHPPYRPADVQFIDSGEQFFVDLDEEPPDPSPARYIGGGLVEGAEPTLTAAATKEDILCAIRETREKITARASSEWPIFNGRKLGVALIQRTRDPKSERSGLTIRVYDTDYHTHLFSRQLYRRLKARGLFLDRDPRNLKGLGGLLTSVGFNIILVADLDGQPCICLTRRSTHVANAGTGGGRLHVTMNEGLSETDRIGSRFDSTEAIHRGFFEELNLNRKDVGEISLLESFIEMENHEFGIHGYAALKIDFRELVERYKRAKDSALESSDLVPIPANVRDLDRFLQSFAGQTTDILRFSIAEMSARGVFEH